jgi:1,4-alpha-glucan branching enzyme
VWKFCFANPGYLLSLFVLRGNTGCNKSKKKMIQKTYYKTKDYCKVKFSIKPENAETVEILGLNNDWKTSIELSKKKDGNFTADVSLPKNSEHEFKYLINKTEWLSDPEADSQKPNSFGGSNSVIVI